MISPRTQFHTLDSDGNIGPYRIVKFDSSSVAILKRCDFRAPVAGGLKSEMKYPSP